MSNLNVDVNTFAADETADAALIALLLFLVTKNKETLVKANETVHKMLATVYDSEAIAQSVKDQVQQRVDSITEMALSRHG